MFDATTQTFANVLFDKLEEQGVDPKLLTALRKGGPRAWDLLAQIIAFSFELYECPFCSKGVSSWGMTEPHDARCAHAQLRYLYDPKFQQAEVDLAYKLAVQYDRRRTNGQRSAAKRKANGTKPKPPRRQKPVTSDRRFIR